MPDQKKLRNKKRKADKTSRHMVTIILLSVFFLVGTAGAFDQNLISTGQTLLQAAIALLIIIMAKCTLMRKEKTKQHIHNRLNRVEHQTKNQYSVIRNKRLSDWSPSNF